jgi:ClpP class serine protease
VHYDEGCRFFLAWILSMVSSSVFQTVTAGKYKRTITPTKKVTKEDFEKTKEDVEQILVLFKEFVKQNRPQLDIDRVATGETWFGEDALKLGLTDEIKTADQLLMDYVDGGYDVYEVAYSPPDRAALALAGVPGTTSADGNSGVFGTAVRWVVRTLVQEIKAELGTGLGQGQLSPEKKYMMLDDSSDYVRSEYK